MVAGPVSDLLAQVGGRLESRPLLEKVAETAARGLARLEQPMRVVVAGEIKKGKSTLVNALVGRRSSAIDGSRRHIVATGQLECTYTVTELIYSLDPGFDVEWTDGHVETFDSLTELDRFTTRHDDLRELNRVRRVIVRVDAPLLQGFRLIDAPGFNSVYKTDSDRALDLITGEQVDGADALLYLFNKGVSDRGQQIVESFVGIDRTQFSAFNSIGVLARCDQYWGELWRPKTIVDPFAFARKERDKLLEHPQLRSLFHTIVPISALMAEGAQLLSDDDLASVMALGKHYTTDELAYRLLVFERDFFEATDLAGEIRPEDRRRLFASLSRYGLLATANCGWEERSVAETRDRLYSESGVGEIRRLLAEHFGDQLATIRCDAILAELVSDARRFQQRAVEVDRYTLQKVIDDTEAFRTSRSDFTELALRTQAFLGNLGLPAARHDELLRMAGANGTEPHQRLGMREDTLPDELRKKALDEKAKWGLLGLTPAPINIDAGLRRETIDDAIRLYDQVIHQIRSHRRNRPSL